MNNSPKVSIIIACFNDPDIEVAVKSANSQTYFNKEIIVVDDGSEKEIKKIINSLNAKIDILITQENKGQSVARNNAIRKASGKYILNWDSDDYFESSFCNKAVAKFEEDIDIKIITCHTRRFTKEGTMDTFIPQGGSLNNFLFANAAIGSSMFRKEDWKRCGGYEEELSILGFEDWEFFIQVLRNGGYAYVIPEILFNYQVRESSTTQKIKHLRQEKFKLIILKHSDLYKRNFEGIIEELFYRIRNEEKQKLKSYHSPEYKFGKLALKPVRALKALLQRNGK